MEEIKPPAEQPTTSDIIDEGPPPRFEILRQEPGFCAIYKPAGFHVHQPEDPRRRVSKNLICMNNLRDQLDQYIYPVHRIDVGTDGVLLFALDKPSAADLCGQFENGVVRKTYFAIVRG
ncbi:MAG: pseudouridine synthase, partial [Bdellovibrionota bacterium]